MKKFEMPEIEVVNVSETANGLFDCCFEFWPIVEKKKQDTPDPTEKESQ